MDTKRQNAGVWIGLIIFLFSGIIFWQSFSLDFFNSLGPGPGLFPLAISSILLLLSSLFILESFKKHVVYFADVLPKGKNLVQLLTIVISLVVFIIIVPFTGFVIASSLFLFALLFRNYPWHLTLVVSIGASIFIFFVFGSLLGMPLPRNVFGW